MFESEISSTNQSKFKFDDSYTFFFEKICKEISNIPIKYTASGQKMLPSSYGFLEMYDVGKIEQLNILERWKKNDSTISLQAPIGIDSAGMPIVLDIHEKFHGPHGLIAGSTGSGKSEFIITYILHLQHCGQHGCKHCWRHTILVHIYRDNFFSMSVRPGKTMA